MAFTRTVAPAIEPIALATARAHCRRGTELDAVLPIYIAAARWEAEHHTQRSFIEQTWELTLDEWPSGEAEPDVRLWHAPVTQIVDVKYIDPAGAVQTLASDRYVLDNRTLPGWLAPAEDTEWPETRAVLNAITIQFKAGYGTTEADVPAPIVRWMLALISAIADNPGMLDPSGKVAALPSRFVDRALDGFVLPSF